jgi:hypothetical protein
MLNLPKRSCLLGVLNPRVEKHGEDDVTAFDIPLSEIMLTANEFSALLQEPKAHEFFYDTGKQPNLPLFPMLADLHITEKIEGAAVTLFIGLDETKVVLLDVKLRKLTLSRKVGGLTALSLQVQCTPDLDGSIVAMLARMTKEISAEISVDGYGEQAQLALAA